MRRVLFIGNSFTFYNDLPGMLQRICGGFQCDSVTRGGAFLHDFVNPNDELHAALLEKKAVGWDYVVLQEQSFNAVGDQDDYLDASEALAGMIDAKPVIYQTWAYEDGSEKLRGKGLSYAEMFTRMETSCDYAARVTHGLLAPVGTAFSIAHDEGLDGALYDDDNYHPTKNGTYLAACVLYRTITGFSPLGLDVPDGVAPQLAQELREIATEVKISNEYR